MPFLKSLPEDGVLLDVFKIFPATALPLIQYHEALMRGPSSFSVAERELIAAYVSGLNNCGYCHGVHTATAEAFGVESHVIRQLVDDDDLDGAPLDDRLKPILRYVKS